MRLLDLQNLLVLVRLASVVIDAPRALVAKALPSSCAQSTEGESASSANSVVLRGILEIWFDYRNEWSEILRSEKRLLAHDPSKKALSTLFPLLENIIAVKEGGRKATIQN